MEHWPAVIVASVVGMLVAAAVMVATVRLAGDVLPGRAGTAAAPVVTGR
jgi:hypothetical protein